MTSVQAFLAGFLAAYAVNALLAVIWSLLTKRRASIIASYSDEFRA